MDGAIARTCAGALTLASLVLAVGCLAEQTKTVEPDWGKPILIPAEQYPKGWRMLDSAEMPMSDKWTWWDRNPVLVQGLKLRAVARTSFNTPAKALFGVYYEYDLDDGTLIAMIALKFGSEAETEAQLKSIKEMVEKSKVAAIGRSRGDASTLFSMFLPDAFPDKEFFYKYFDSICLNPSIPPRDAKYEEPAWLTPVSKEAQEWAQRYFIPEESLPKGWRLQVKSELPIDPWWKPNPRVLERAQIEADVFLRLFDRSKPENVTKAVRIACIAYARAPLPKDYQPDIIPRMEVVVLQYQNAEDARREFTELPRGIRVFKTFKYIGYSILDENTLVFMRFTNYREEDIPVAEQFFKSITKPAGE